MTPSGDCVYHGELDPDVTTHAVDDSIHQEEGGEVGENVGGAPVPYLRLYQPQVQSMMPGAVDPRRLQ